MRVRSLTLLAAAALLCTAPLARATSFLQMNLADLTQRSGSVFRGTVIGIDTGTVKAGGANLPTITYKLKVAEDFKGDFVVKGDTKYAEIRMIGLSKADTRSGNVRRAAVLRDVPRLEVNREYLLFATAPSRAGLSTTVGLGQGCFTIHGQGAKATAVNEFNNVGLYRGMAQTQRAARPSRGPVSYSEIAGQVRGLVGR